jgi:hypothetical protein
VPIRLPACGRVRFLPLLRLGRRSRRVFWTVFMPAAPGVDLFADSVEIGPSRASGILREEVAVERKIDIIELVRRRCGRFVRLPDGHTYGDANP